MITTFYQLVEHLRKNHTDHRAFRYMDEEKETVVNVSYQQFIQDVYNAAVHYQTSPEFRSGTCHVGFLAENSYWYIVHVFGVVLAGHVAVLLNTRNNFEALDYEIHFSDIACILHDGMYLNGAPMLGEKYGTMLRKLEALPECSRENREAFKPDDNADRLSFLIFTSGTTDKSKGVMLSQRNILAGMKTVVNMTDEMSGKRGYADTFLLMLPLYHVFGICSVLVTLHYGGDCAINRNISTLFRDLEKMPCNLIGTVPSMLNYWSKELSRGHLDALMGIKGILCGAAAIDAELMKRFMAHGIMMVQLYGCTETRGTGTVNLSQNPETCASVGRVYEDLNIKIEDGEICFKGDGIMLGYYKDEAATKEAIIDGWYHTGDLGYVDEDGMVYLTGRKKNLIILSGGENVSPEELEAAVRGCPAVLEVLVSQNGDRIQAEVYCREADQEQIRQHVAELNRKLPFFKRIAKVIFCSESLPKTALGKIKRNSNGGKS